MDTDGCLGADDPLPNRPHRVLVGGASGAGKTILAAEVGRRLGLPYTEIDGLYHGPGWTPRPAFLPDVQALASGDRWVTEWQYGSVRELLGDRADLVVWLDLPRATVLAQVVGRTLRRRLRRQQLWNGNVEPSLLRLFTDPEHIVRWSWTTHPQLAPRIAALRQRHPLLTVVRLRSRREVRAWLGGPLSAAAELFSG